MGGGDVNSGPQACIASTLQSTSPVLRLTISDYTVPHKYLQLLHANKRSLSYRDRMLTIMIWSLQTAHIYQTAHCTFSIWTKIVNLRVWNFSICIWSRFNLLLLLIWFFFSVVSHLAPAGLDLAMYWRWTWTPNCPASTFQCWNYSMCHHSRQFNPDLMHL